MIGRDRLRVVAPSERVRWARCPHPSCIALTPNGEPCPMHQYDRPPDDAA